MTKYNKLSNEELVKEFKELAQTIESYGYISSEKYNEMCDELLVVQAEILKRMY